MGPLLFHQLLVVGTLPRDDRRLHRRQMTGVHRPWPRLVAFGMPGPQPHWTVSPQFLCPDPSGTDPSCAAVFLVHDPAISRQVTAGRGVAKAAVILAEIEAIVIAH